MRTGPNSEGTPEQKKNDFHKKIWLFCKKMKKLPSFDFLICFGHGSQGQNTTRSDMIPFGIWLHPIFPKPIKNGPKIHSHLNPEMWWKNVQHCMEKLYKPDPDTPNKKFDWFLIHKKALIDQNRQLNVEEKVCVFFTFFFPRL